MRGRRSGKRWGGRLWRRWVAHEKHPRSKIQDPEKIQAPRSKAPDDGLEFGPWIFSGSWILDLGSFCPMTFLTELKEGLLISWGAIRANKMRSILTTLGIVIGILTVTLMGTAIEGLNKAFLNSVSFIGADVLYVSRFDWM